MSTVPVFEVSPQVEGSDAPDNSTVDLATGLGTVVDVDLVNRFLNNPLWNDQQRLVAATITAGVEHSLGEILGGVYLVPERITERVPILASTGQLVTEQPVHTIIAVNGVDVTPTAVTAPKGTAGSTPDADMPSGWVHRRYDVRCAGGGGGYPGEVAVTRRSVDPLTDGYPWHGGGAHVPTFADTVIDYWGGYGRHPAIVLAVLRKVQVLMHNRTDTSSHAASRPGSTRPPINPEDWSDRELIPLGALRRIGIFR